MNLHDPGFLQSSGFSTGFAVSNASVSLATIWIGVMIPEIQCWWCLHHFLITVEKEKTEEEMGKLANTVEMASLDAEMIKW